MANSTSRTERRHFASETVFNEDELAGDGGGPRVTSTHAPDSVGLRVVTEDTTADLATHPEPEGWAMMSLVMTRLRAVNLELRGILLPEDQDADVVA
jgi:hypothetical protein